jgi:PE-PPE domain
MTTVLCLAGAFGQPQQVDQMLGGSVVAGNTVNNLEYFNDWLTQECVTNGEETGGAQVLDAALCATTGQVIVLAHSLGSVCCYYWLANYAPTTSVSHSNVRFILLGNSVRPFGGWCYYYNWFQNIVVPPNNPFLVTDFARQYDGWADFVPGAAGNGPANPEPQLTATTFNGIMNAYAGQNCVHPNYIYSSLTGPNHVGYQVGNITYVWEQTFPVPQIGSRNLSGQWVSSLGLQVAENSFNAQDMQLRPAIEKAYKRPVTIPIPNYTVE